MNEPGVEVEGLNRFVSTWRRAGADMADFKDANQRAGTIVVSAANLRVPRRTGALASSIRSARQVKKAVVYYGKASVPYAGPIHWGWPSHHIRAQPFVTDAAQETEPIWTREYSNDLQKIVDGIRGA
jgi:hypothetical protein